MRKLFLIAFLTAIIMGGLTLVSTAHFSTVQASTDVSGIISSNTTWTKTSSPYSLTGPVTIGNGVILTIEAGATVNLNGYKIQASTELASIPKPSVPEFTVELIDSSYDVPTTYSIDPYTGANVTHPSHRVDNRSIELIIKNQPFTPVLVQIGTSNWTAYFHYNVRVKRHFEENWINRYSAGGDAFPTASNSEYTVISFPVTLSSPTQSGDVVHYNLSPIFYELPSNAQIDFQVEAMIGFV